MTSGPLTDSALVPLESFTVDDLIRLVRDPKVPRHSRLAAGAALARHGDPRPGILTLEPEWCTVVAGAFVMGSASTDLLAHECERPQHVMRLPTFRVSRYPVTNAQWQRFVDDDGYDESDWWTTAGWRARISRGWRTPRFWQDEEWTGNQANRPVVGVSWYEAMAYCRWLSSRLMYDVRLCTEAEWEKAARGRDARLYPFGNQMDTEALHAGGAAVSCGAPAPVGCYPRGVSPWAVEDLVGNTYAWTTSHWGPAEATPGYRYPYEGEDGREETLSDDYRVVRGGAWSFPLRSARCSYRGKDRPEEAFNNLGVRIVAGG